MSYYTTGDIANLLGVSKPTVSNWLSRGYIEQGKLPKPEIVTISGLTIWNSEQAEQIKVDYLKRKELEAEIAKLKAQLATLQTEKKEKP